jgi:hypothetical protein
LTDVRRADARSAQIGSPDGIAQCFQVSAYSVEPRPAVSTRNLLSKDDWREALGDEATPLGPEMPLVVGAFASAGDGEGLAGAGASPDGSVVGPSGESERVAPDSDAGEEVRLRSSSNRLTGDLQDASGIDLPSCDVASLDEVGEPLRRVRVELVVVIQLCLPSLRYRAW